MEMLVYDRKEKEGLELVRLSRNSVAYLSDDRLQVYAFKAAAEVERFLGEKGLMDAALMEIADGKGLELVRRTRESHESAQLLLLADRSVSPMEYLTPQIRAMSLLLRPFSAAEAKRVVEEFFHTLYRSREEKDDRALTLENRDGKIRIPFSRIYYLEVREKKVFVRLKDREYSRYGTLDHMIRELPEHFIRCHRSFVVNSQYINRVKLSENSIYLTDDILVPLSRSYKGAVKEYMDGLRRI
ncbi:MAG TPA: hypothetical protein DF613_09760 [Lachnospiraceae bacterium]|nr:hypothetical protein [Lachnospiraceae bacterium]